MRINRFASMLVLTAAMMLLASPTLAFNCNAVCKTQADGCIDCDFALFCNDCWCRSAGCRSCDEFTCIDQASDGDSVNLAAGANTGLVWASSGAACSGGAIPSAVESDSQPSASGRIEVQVTELAPRS